MPAPFIIPFDNNPVSIVRGTTATYTVPAGKFARILISIDHDFDHSLTAGSGSLNVAASAKSSKSKNFEIWLNAGSTLVMATTNTNGSASFGSPASFSITATATIASTITIGGILWNTITSKGSFTVAGTWPSGGTITTSIGVNCFSSFGYISQEYNIIS